MNIEALFLFLILLLGLLLSSFLGGNNKNENFTGNFSGTFSTLPDNKVQTKNNYNRNLRSNYDNYNHYNGYYTNLQNGTTFNGPNGGTIVVNTNNDGVPNLKVTLANGTQPLIFYSKDLSNNNINEGYTNYNNTSTFYGPNGDTATVINTNKGQEVINVQTDAGSYTFTQSGTYYNPDNTTSTQFYGSTGYPIQTSGYSLAYEGPYGRESNGRESNGRESNGEVSNGRVSYGGEITPYYNGTSSNQYYGPYSGRAGTISEPKGLNENIGVKTTNNNGYGNTYSSTLPRGIPASQIPIGQEDLYILKSEIVPPVCPACPTSSACPRQEPCPPCEPCGRCPEPAFECKKVPNYNAIDEQYLPQPVLNDFSQFGM